MAVLLQDAFTQADNTAWNATRWTPATTPAAGGVAVIGNAGRLLTGSAGSYSPSDRVSVRQAGPTAANVNIIFSFKLSGDDCYPAVIARGDAALNTEDGYALHINPNGEWFVAKYVDYAGTDLATGALPIQTGEKWWARFRVFGTTSPVSIQARIWKDGTTEPTTWTASINDSTAPITTAGHYGFSVGGGAGTGGSGGTEPALTVSAVPASDGAVKVLWSLANATASSFTVGRNGNDSGGAGPWSTVDPASASSRTFDKLVNGNAYTFTVTANLTTGGTLTQTATATPVALPTLNLTASPGDTYVLVGWALANATATSYTVGRDGTDSGGTGPYSTTDPGTATSRQFNALLTGTNYTFTVTANLSDGSALTKTISATPAASARKVPLVGFSGLGHNSLVFLPDTSAAGANAFGSLRGRQMDGLLFFPGRGTWSDLRGRANDHISYLASGRIIVTSVPHAPQNEGPEMNQRGADNWYMNEQRALGAYWASQGLNSNRHIIRLNWEANGNWYPWSNQNGGPEVFKAAFRNFVNNLRAGGCTQVRFNLCWNKGPSQTGHDFDTFPGAEYCDIVAVDAYDRWYPSFNNNDWNNAINQSPGLQTVRNFAVANGVMWALDEGASCWPNDGQEGGGDNPFFWQKNWEFVNNPANAAHCAYHVTYNDPGNPDTLRHDFARNPNSFAWYRQAAYWGGY